MSCQIIKEQELIIGPIAWDEAKKVSGLTIVDIRKGEVSFSIDDPRGIVDRLIARYERLFGRASHEVCRDAVHDLVASLPDDQVPDSLK